MIKESNGSLDPCQQHRQERWAVRFEECFDQPNATIGLPYMTEGGIIKADVSSPSEMEVAMEISFLGGY